jgi:hypothetical protein
MQRRAHFSFARAAKAIVIVLAFGPLDACISDVSDGLRNGIEQGVSNGGAKVLANAKGPVADMGDALAARVRDTLTNEETKRKLADLERALVAGLRDPLTSQETLQQIRRLELQVLSDLREQLKGAERDLLGGELEAALERARQKVIGPDAVKDVEKLRDALLGKATEDRIAKIVENALGESTQARVGALRDELIGGKAQRAIDALIEETMKKVGDQFDLQITPRLHTEAAELQARINKIVWGVAAAAIVVMASAWFLLRRMKEYRSLLALLTTKIDNIKSPAIYDQLTSSVSERAKERGLEPLLRRVLVEQGINDNEAEMKSAA